MFGEGRKGPPEYRDPCQQAILLGRARPGTAAATGRHDQRSDFHIRSFRTPYAAVQAIYLAETLGTEYFVQNLCSLVRCL